MSTDPDSVQETHTETTVWAPDLSETIEERYAIDVDQDNRILTRTNERTDGTLIDFALIHRIRIFEDEWADAARVDTAHGTVHCHEFGPSNTESKHEIMPIVDERDVTRGYDAAVEVIYGDMDERYGRWTGGH